MQTKLTPPWHPGKHCANQQLNWLSPDTEDKFQKLIQDPICQQYFDKQGWLPKGAITYNINSDGFRSEEFETDNPCIIALGCSFTVGIGLPLKSVWPTVLGNALNFKVCNLGWGGSSADTCFRLARYWIPQLKPVAVFMLTPPLTRIELLMAPGTTPPAEVFLPMSQSKHYEPHDLYLKHWFTNDDNAIINSEKNKLAIGEICRLNNTRFYSLDNQLEEGVRDTVGYARDYMHAGPQLHQMIAEKFLKQYYE